MVKNSSFVDFDLFVLMYLPCLVKMMSFSGNSLGEDGCQTLKDAMEAMKIGQLLGSLR